MEELKKDHLRDLNAADKLEMAPSMAPLKLRFVQDKKKQINRNLEYIKNLLLFISRRDIEDQPPVAQRTRVNPAIARRIKREKEVRMAEARTAAKERTEPDKSSKCLVEPSPAP